MLASCHTSWGHALTLFEQASELPQIERHAYLNQVCAQNSDLRQQVQALLDAHENAPAFLTQGALPLAKEMHDEQSQTTANAFLQQRVGPYRLTRKIGEGGMGVVYLGEREASDFKQQVAVKLLPGDSCDANLRTRFNQEKQALAALNHPGIARLYDGGWTTQGVPYIVMEYIEGIPIDEYCSAHKLSISCRLELVVQVARALQHAHQSLIVHRDLKPSNILVTAEGKIKLLDFGIAKLIDRTAANHRQTQAGQSVFTPRYAAPEQLKGTAITVGTDIYQLGILMFELLSGGRPYAENPTDVYQLIKTICDEPPLAPSLAVTKMEPGQAALMGEQRSVTASQLKRGLRGDLDAIVLHTLGKQAAHRYASMEALLVDIDAVQKSLPVKATKQGWAYKASRFIGRNRLGVATAFVLATVTMSYVATLTLHADRIATALAHTKIEARKSEQVSQFLIELFGSSNPDTRPGEIITVRQLLDAGQEKVTTSLVDAPEVRSHMLQVLGNINYSLGNYDQSVELLNAGLQTHVALPAPDKLIEARMLAQLGMAFEANDDFTQAENSLKAAISIWRENSGDRAVLAESLNAYGLLQQRLGKFDMAETHIQEAISILRTVDGGQNYELAVALNNLSLVATERGQYSKAELLMSEAVVLQEQVLGEDHSYFSVSLGNLAKNQIFLGHYDLAEPKLQRVLALQKKNLGTDHPYVAYTLHALGFLERKRGRLELAEDYLNSAITLQRQGEEELAMASTMRALAGVYKEQGQYELARSMYAEMFAIDERAHAPDSPRIGRNLALLASLATAVGDFEEARSLFDQAFKLLSPGSKGDAIARFELAKLFYQTQQWQAAKEAVNITLEFRQSKLPPDHPDIDKMRRLLSDIVDAASANNAESLLPLADTLPSY